MSPPEDVRECEGFYINGTARNHARNLPADPCLTSRFTTSAFSSAKVLPNTVGDG
jgi:hypothetical protein